MWITWIKHATSCLSLVYLLEKYLGGSRPVFVTHWEDRSGGAYFWSYFVCVQCKSMMTFSPVITCVRDLKAKKLTWLGPSAKILGSFHHVRLAECFNFSLDAAFEFWAIMCLNLSGKVQTTVMLSCMWSLQHLFISEKTSNIMFETRRWRSALKRPRYKVI